MKNWIAEYVVRQKAALDSIPSEAVAQVVEKFLPASNDQWVCAPGWKPVGQ